MQIPNKNGIFYNVSKYSTRKYFLATSGMKKKKFVEQVKFSCYHLVTALKSKKQIKIEK